MAKAAKNAVIIPPGRLYPNAPSGAEMKIEVMGATGDFEAGKTILGLSIAPGNHPTGHPFEGKPRTLYLDFEKSGGTYGGSGCKRIDVPAEMLKVFGDKPYTAYDVFVWFHTKVVQKIKPGQFDVVFGDPATDLEGGLVAWIKRHPEAMGYTANQINKSGGLMWGAVKDRWKQILLELSAKCQTFYFTSHLRSVWAGDKPAPGGKKEPKGKETLLELASLYLWLERKPGTDGKVPDKPAAIVLKQRLADTFMDDEGSLQVIPLLPPRLPVATAESIRQYIANPPNYKSLKQGERVIEKGLSDDEKLLIAQQTAEAQRDTQENQLAFLNRQAELRKMNQQRQDQQDLVGAPPKSSDQVAQRQADKTKAIKDAEKARAEEVEAAKLEREVAEGLAKGEAAGKKLMEDNNSGTKHPSDPPLQFAAEITEEQAAEIEKLYTEIVEADASFRDKFIAGLNKLGVERVPELTEADAARMIASLQKHWLSMADDVPFN
ncbi:MAG: AAA family ATPase [Chloroflexi bacterium]|nr:AAA family ATPase [Chloroflexota bacterium]